MIVVDHLSLLHGIVPPGVLLLTGTGLAVTVLRRSRRWWSVTLPRLAAATGVVVAGLGWYLRHSGTVEDHYPPTFGLWIGASLLALLVAVAGWRSAAHWRRVVSVAAVPLTVASAFLLINAHYGYWPTVGDLLGHPLPNETTSRALAGLLGRRAGSVPNDWLRPKNAGKGAADVAPVPATPGGLHGVLAPLDIPPGTSGFEHRPGTLYLPPAFFDTPRPQLPVIVMLSGTPSGPDAWPRAGFAPQTADAYASRHQGVAPILAFVDHNGSFANDTECVDGPRGNAETFLSHDVPRFLSAMLHVPLDPRHWAIAGFSEGGTCAFELGVRHPDVYGAFIDLAGDRAPNLGSATNTLHTLYGGNRAAMAAHDPTNLLRPLRFRNLSGWFVAGASDTGHVAVANGLTRAASSAGITTSEAIMPGAHDWQFAAAAFRAVLPSVTQRLAALPGTGTATGVA